MSIAIKKLEGTDISAFENFLKSDREELPRLRLAPLAAPHEDIAVVAYKRGTARLEGFAERYQFVLSAYDGGIVSLSRRTPVQSVDHSRYIFSGYTFYRGKMLIGMNEVAETVEDIRDLRETYGEFSACIIGGGQIICSSDFFGMVPWFYFDNDQIFAASNNYHLMLLLLTEIGVKLSMNIPRSRVNIITSGFTYGTVFSKDLDVGGCKVNLAYEELHYSSLTGGGGGG